MCVLPGSFSSDDFASLITESDCQCMQTQLTPLSVGFARALWASFCFRFLPLYEVYLVKITVLIKEIIKIIYNQLFNLPDRLTPLLSIILFYYRHALQASLSGTFLPNSARFGYATERALFYLLSADAVRALRRVRVLI